MSKLYETHLAQYVRVFERHVLVEELRTPTYAAYLLHDPAMGRINAVRILFTPEGIALLGDHTPEVNGSVSSYGYGEEWFGMPKDGRYLAQKFLKKRWVPELCAESLTAELAEQDERAKNGEADWKEEQRAGVRLLITGIDDMGQHGVAEDLEEILGDEYADGPPGYDYDPREMACLVAIQHRFAALYKAEERKWKAQSERYRKLIETSMEKYSGKLGWGLTGAQEECWTMLDLSVDELVRLKRELPGLATQLQDWVKHFREEDSANAFCSALDSLKKLGIEPHQTVAGA